MEAIGEHSISLEIEIIQKTVDLMAQKVFTEFMYLAEWLTK